MKLINKKESLLKFANLGVGIIIYILSFQICASAKLLADFLQSNLLPKPYSNYSGVFSNITRGFEPNRGQIENSEGEAVNNVLFSTKEKGFSLYLRKDGISYVLYRTKGKTGSTLHNRRADKLTVDDSRVEYARIDLELLNANIQNNNIVYEDPLPGYTNYYLSSCPDGILNVQSYRKITVKSVYPGIDWIFRYDESGELHHEFVISSGSDVNQIRFKVRWAEVELGGDGREIVFSTPVGEIKDGKIVSYEGSNNVDVKYKINGEEISYEVKNWTGKEKLIIDPPLALLWATYYGGSSDECGTSIHLDMYNNILVTGYTYSTDFPTQNPGGGIYFQGIRAGGYDIFILKFNSSGERLWATYYGGTWIDEGTSISTDGAGNIFVTGWTSSPDFPVYNPGGGAYFKGLGGGNYTDAFMLKFTNTGVRLWATYYGGNGNELPYALAPDFGGNIFVVGYTNSTNMDVRNPGGGAYFQANNAGETDIFILKFTNGGILQWATYYGGNNYEAEIGGYLAIDGNGNLFITANTHSTNFPTYNPGGGAYFQGSQLGGYDVVILKFNNTGIRLWATYYGGSGDDYGGMAIAADPSGNIYVTGETISSDFPVYNPGGGTYFQGTNNAAGAAYILKFSNSGVRLWATFFSGTGWDTGFSICSDNEGNIFLTGRTSSDDFPLFNPGGGAYFQAVRGGGTSDLFLASFSSNNSLYWSTYYGGNNEDYGLSIKTATNGNLFVSGYSKSNNFPTLAQGVAYYQGTFSGGNIYGDAYILKFQSLTVNIQQTSNAFPESFKLYQNYPNPFNPITNIEFDVPKNTYVVIEVFDINGRKISTLVDEFLNGRTYRVKFDGQGLPSGIYFYTMTANNFMQTKKMLLLK
ncbi:MAG: SBBP repeat-containing protein [Ignavibacteria bacterium]